MSAVTTLPWSRPLTSADLEVMPDDGHRYELLDGTLVVTPSPAPVHQRAVGALFIALHANRPQHLRVYVAPLDVHISDLTVLAPDVLVADPTAFSRRGLSGPPLLAVEVLSPSTRKIDLTLKRAMYEACGTQFYWVVDPAEPSFTAWRLIDGAYVQTGQAVGDEALELDEPYPVRVVPAELVADS